MNTLKPRKTMLNVLHIFLWGLFLYSSHAVTLSAVRTSLECSSLRTTTKDRLMLPCECRSADPAPYACHPRCCPKNDRCHEENMKTWTPYEQTICHPPTTTQNYLNDGVCWRTYAAPNKVIGTRVGTEVRVSFLLSLQTSHACVDLLIAACRTTRAASSDVLLRTSSGAQCWMSCPVSALASCTSTSCLYNRGRTHPFVRQWEGLPNLPTGTYALVCQSVFRVAGTAAGQAEINQTVYSSSAFSLP